MKKLFCLIIVVMLASVAMYGCNNGTDKQPANPTAAPTAQATATPEPPATQAPTDEPSSAIVYKSEDCFGNFGYQYYVCGATSDYAFSMDNGGTEVTWTVFILDEEFPDSLRYIPQAYTPSLTESGTLHITAGQYVYILCSVNTNTASEPANGATITVTPQA